MIIKHTAMKTSTRILSFSVPIIFLCLSAMGQGPQNHEKRMEKYRSMKIAYFTENIELTPEDAEKFWPLYNKYDQQKHELRMNRRLRSKEFSQQAEQLSEQEAEKIIDRHMEIRQKELQLDMEFHNELKQVLSSKKIMKFYITEVQFREYMLRRIREERGEPNRKREKQLP